MFNQFETQFLDRNKIQFYSHLIAGFASLGLAGLFMALAVDVLSTSELDSLFVRLLRGLPHAGACGSFIAVSRSFFRGLGQCQDQLIDVVRLLHVGLESNDDPAAIIGEPLKRKTDGARLKIKPMPGKRHNRTLAR